MDTGRDKDRIVDSLNDLIHIVEDSHEGYRRATGDSDDKTLKVLFDDLAAERGAVVRELQHQVAELGSAPATSGSLLGSAHRLFVDLKSILARQDRAAILSEVERGETECVRRFEHALDQDLPRHVAELVQDHLARLKRDLDRVTALRQTS